MSLVTLLFIVLTSAQLNEAVTIKPVEGCSHSDMTKVSSCAPILLEHLDDLLLCNVECSVLTSLVQCVNREKVSATCAAAAGPAIDRYFSTFGVSCTYERLKTSCPDLPEIIPAGATTLLTEKLTESVTISVSMQERTTLGTPTWTPPMAEFNTTMKDLRCSMDDKKRVTPCLTADITYLQSLRTKCTVDCKLFGEMIRCVNEVGLSKICQENFPKDVDNLLRRFGPEDCTFQRIVQSCPNAPKVGDPVKPGAGNRGNEVSGQAGGGAVGAVYTQGTLALMTAAVHVIQLIFPGRLLV